MPDVQFVRGREVVVFAVFYCLLDLVVVRVNLSDSSLCIDLSVDLFVLVE